MGNLKNKILLRNIGYRFNMKRALYLKYKSRG